MKYGILMHTSTKNLGDDIQSYAIARQLPSADYAVDREHLDTFQAEEGELVAVPMCAWWMWQKWNWPPAKSIIPKMIGMHFTNYDEFHKGSTITNQWIQGIGGEYMKAWGPIGCRDFTSLDYMKSNGIPAYFSGCITLTLPKQKELPDKGSYVCLVDLPKDVEEKAKLWLQDSGLEIRTYTHDMCEQGQDYETRMKQAEEILTIYQNAKFVVTRRLHVSLPCLAMETPVLSVVNLNDPRNPVRWNPYKDWVHYVSNEDFIDGNFEWDIQNPPANKTEYVETRNQLMHDMKQFVEEMEHTDWSTKQDWNPCDFTEEQAKDWQMQMMKDALEQWLYSGRKLLAEKNAYKKQLEQLQKEKGN